MERSRFRVFYNLTEENCTFTLLANFNSKHKNFRIEKAQKIYGYVQECSSV